MHKVYELARDLSEASLSKLGAYLEGESLVVRSRVSQADESMRYGLLVETSHEINDGHLERICVATEELFGAGIIDRVNVQPKQINTGIST